MGSYNAVKAAVVAFTETTGHELASSGGTAHAVCPSYFRTNLTESLRSADPAVGGVMRRLVEESPISADDIAAAVLEGLAARRRADRARRRGPSGVAAEDHRPARLRRS